MTTVIHCHGNRVGTNYPINYVYCGRPSRWGNPFAIGRDGNRAQVIWKFYEYWHDDEQRELRMAACRELIEKTLGCWCKPDACHCDVIAAYVNYYGATLL